MKKSIAFIVFGLMLIPLFGFAQPKSSATTGSTPPATTGSTPPATTGSTPPATTGSTPPATTGSTPPASAGPSVPLENSGGPLTQPAVPGGPLTQPAVPGGQTTPVQPRAALENPLGSKANSLTGLFIKLVNIVVNISYAVVAFFLILSGFKFVVAQGNPKEIESAKQTFWYTIVGGLIIVGAQTIARILENLVKSL